MERSRLKNILICILILVNLMMLIALASIHIQQRSAKRRLTAQLTSMFQTNGIVLSASGVPQDLPPAGGALLRSTEEERAMSTLLLGKSLRKENAGGGIYNYSSANGTATFRSGGSFDITGKLSGRHPEKLCRDFCRTYGYENLKLSVKNGSGQGKATQYCNGYRIVNCTVSFLIEGGRLISVSGTHVPCSEARLSGAVPHMTAATALTRFLEAHRQSGTVVSKIRRVFPCYRLRSSVSVPLTLSPVWRIITDTGNYDVNCATGTVSGS